MRRVIGLGLVRIGRPEDAPPPSANVTRQSTSERASMHAGRQAANMHAHAYTLSTCRVGRAAVRYVRKSAVARRNATAAARLGANGHLGWPFFKSSFSTHFYYYESRNVNRRLEQDAYINRKREDIFPTRKSESCPVLRPDHVTSSNLLT